MNQEVKEVMAKPSKKPPDLKDKVKLAIMIENSEYEGKNTRDTWSWRDLPGAKKDLTDMEAKMKANSYRVEVVENSEDILTAVQGVMNKTPVSSVTHLQVLYVGG